MAFDGVPEESVRAAKIIMTGKAIAETIQKHFFHISINGKGEKP